MTMELKRYDVVIVGGGHAGAQTAIALRQQKFAGSIAIVGAEPLAPYERPPLSKDYLKGAKSLERILIRPQDFWREKEINLLLGQRVEAVDPTQSVVVLSSGSRVQYGDLVWAAGGTPRNLACNGRELAGVHTVRDKSDVDRVREELAGASRKVAIVGGGYIGLEVAAVLTELGCEVVVLEALDRVLARVAGEDISRFFEAMHRAKGVDLRLATMIDCLESDDTRVTGVRLSDGEVVACDMVIVGIGITPNVEPLAAAGARVSNGVEVDEFCRTSLPRVYAIGDCAAHESRFVPGRHIRLESVQNANDMAATAAKAICGVREPYSCVPWFWSNQYGVMLQTVGLSVDHDAVVVRGDPESGSFSVVYMREGGVAALDCVSAVKDYVQGKKLVETGARIPLEMLQDSNTPLKEMAVKSYVTD